jgi:hypothetical protein
VKDYTVTNRSRFLVTVPLNDGTSVHLAPGETATLKPFQVTSNVKVRKLYALKAIHVEPDPAPPAASAATAKAAPKTGGHARGQRRKKSTKGTAKGAVKASTAATEVEHH